MKPWAKYRKKRGSKQVEKTISLEGSLGLKLKKKLTRRVIF